MNHRYVVCTTAKPVQSAARLCLIVCIALVLQQSWHVCGVPAGKLAVSAAALNGSILPRTERDRSTADDSPVIKAQVG